MTAIAKRKHTKLIIIILVAIVALAALWAAPFVFQTAEKPVVVKIRKGSDAAAIGEELRSRLGDGMGSRVMTLLKLMNANLDNCYGAYNVDIGATPLSVARAIRNHRRAAVKVVLHEFRTIDNLCSFLGGSLMIEPDSLKAALSSPEICEKYGKKPQTVIGIFIPDTYDIYWHTSIGALLDKLYANYNSFWNETRVEKAKSLGLTPDEMITVASICEEESNIMSDRGTIGRLYINRLRKGMPLQADPTVKFALGDFSIKRISGDMLNVDSPYNTYRYKGLPPGPIRMVDKRTIDAIFAAGDNNYLYMCAKEDFSGLHNFTSSFAEHQQNARRYQKALNERGIK